MDIIEENYLCKRYSIYLRAIYYMKVNILTGLITSESIFRKLVAQLNNVNII